MRYLSRIIKSSKVSLGQEMDLDNKVIVKSGLATLTVPLSSLSLPIKNEKK